jgi:hypothetical protein
MMPPATRDRLRAKYRAADPVPKENVMAVVEAPLSTVPGVPDADDLPDTISVPPGATAPLPPITAAFQDALLEELRATVRVLDATCTRIAPWLEGHTATLTALLTQHQTTLSAAEASVLQHLCDVLAQGVTVLSAPYQAQVMARMPSGYVVTVAITHREGGTFLEALTNLENWLQTTGYTPVVA